MGWIPLTVIMTTELTTIIVILGIYLFFYIVYKIAEYTSKRDDIKKQREKELKAYELEKAQKEERIRNNKKEQPILTQEQD